MPVAARRPFTIGLAALLVSGAAAPEPQPGADSVTNFPETFSILALMVLGGAAVVLAGVLIVRALRRRL